MEPILPDEQRHFDGQISVDAPRLEASMLQDGECLPFELAAHTHPQVLQPNLESIIAVPSLRCLRLLLRLPQIVKDPGPGACRGLSYK